MTDKVSALEEELENLAGLDEIPEEALTQAIDHTSEFFNEYVTPRLELQTLSQIHDDVENEQYENKNKKRRALGEKMPPEIAGVMAHAYQEFYAGNNANAIHYANDARRTLPNAPEPYEILAEIAKSEDDFENALTFTKKAAERARDAMEVWQDCYSLAMRLNRPEEAASYLREAAKSSPDQIDCLVQLLNLLKTDVDDKRLTNFCLNELTKRRPTEPSFAREYALFLHESGKFVDSLEVLKTNFQAMVDAGLQPDLGNANLLGENYLDLGKYEDVIMLDNSIIDPPEDFHTNAAIAYIRTKRYREAEEKLKDFFTLDVITHIEAYEAIGQAYVDNKYYIEAANWYKHMHANGVEKRFEIATCLTDGGKFDEAIDILQQLVIDQPSHTPAVGQLFFLMKSRMGDKAAIDWMRENAPTAAQTDDIVLHEADVAYSHGDYQQFIDIGCILVCRVLYDIYSMKYLELESKQIEKLLGITVPEKMPNYMKKVLMHKRFSEAGVIPLDDQTQFFNLAQTMLTIAYENDFIEQALVLGALLVICREKLEKSMEYHILFLFSLAAFKADHGDQACSVMRAVLLETKDTSVWEFFNLFIQKTPDQESYAHKFLLRASHKLPDNVPLQILLGNHSQSTVWFDHAITQYLNVLRTDPDEPIVSLLLASAYLSKAYVRTQKATRKSVLCAFACMRKYIEVRNIDFPVECDYNMARFYQAIKMMPQAEMFYRKVLESEPDYSQIAGEDMEMDHNMRYSLQRDAAYNLSLIYKETNPNEARRIMKKYLTVQ